MFEVTVQACFRAAHAVRLASGEMETPHEHDWEVEVFFEGPTLDDRELLVDFVVVQDRLRRAVQPLQGADLNRHVLLAGASPTAENVAHRLFEELGAHDWRPARLCRVTVREAPGCAASYTAH